METLQHCAENDDLLVDDLFDFTCGDIGESDGCAATCMSGKEADDLQNSDAMSSLEKNCLSSSREAVEAPESLYLPPDDQAELEWLSSFVEESHKDADNSLPFVSTEQWFSKSTGGRKEGYFMTPGGDGKRPTSWLRLGPFSQILDVGSSPLTESPNTHARAPCWSHTLHLQRSRTDWDKRSRSKRSSRSCGRVWSLQRVMSVSQRKSREEEADDGDQEEASSLDYEPYTQENFEQRKKMKKGNSNYAAVGQEGRRCSHCQVQKTPQWRAGPLGPKTLCNACGVRYKSGRLLPEYRPAASPTFISDLHSNSHKKVLEMRNYKSCVAQELDQEDFSSCSQESISSLQNQEAQAFYA